MLTDLGHKSHRLSVSVEESTLAVCQCFCLGSEEDRGKAVLHLPDIQFLVVGYCHGHTAFGLEKQTALIVLLREVLGIEIVDVRLQAVKEFALHWFCSFRWFCGVGSQGAIQS